MSVSLQQHLMSFNGDILKGWLRRVDGLEKGLTRKDQFAGAIERQLTTRLATVLARLSEAERQLLAESAHQQRLMSARQFTAKYGGTCPMPGVYGGRRGEVSLLVPFIYLGDYRASEPPALIASFVHPLRQLLPKPEALRAETVDQPPASWPADQQSEGGERLRILHRFESERLAPAELARVLRLVQGGKAKVTDSSRRPTDATTRLVGEALVTPDLDLEMPADHLRSEWDRKHYTPAGPVRAHAWPVLLQQCGWARCKGGTLALTATGKTVLQQFTPAAFRAGVSRMLANADFDELNRINHIRGQSGKARRWMSDPGLRKLAIAAAMRLFPVGQWLPLQDAVRLVEGAPESWDVLPRGNGVLYFAELHYGCIQETEGINRQFLRAFLTESLATLGLVDIAYVYPHHLWPDLSENWGVDDLAFCGRYDGLLFVRLNPLGAYALELTDRYELHAEATPKLFRVLPNLDLLLADTALNPADRAMLELLALPKSDGVWTLNAERMLTHVESGGTFRELRDFLETSAIEGLPESVEAYLAGFEFNLGACRTRRDAVLLEWADDALALMIANDPGTCRLCLHAGQNRVVVPASNIAAFSRAVKRLGYVLPQPSAKD